MSIKIPEVPPISMFAKFASRLRAQRRKGMLALLIPVAALGGPAAHYLSELPFEGLHILERDRRPDDPTVRLDASKKNSCG